MILLVVGLVAVLVVVFIAVILSIRLGHGDEHDEPDLPLRDRDGRPDDEDEHWLERDTRQTLSAGARGYDGPPRRPARADATGYREPAAARAPVPASARARSRYDTGPQRRHADGDFPLADYPSMDFGPAGARTSGEFPAADYGAMDPPEDRPRSRRKGASANSKSRSRQRGKRTNDDDWPSTEWDKLSDEQYWAELSADKPLAATAKPSRPASRSAAKALVNGSAKRAAEPPAAREPRRARTPALAERDVPSRNERTEPREPVDERLPVRTRQQPPPPGARRDSGAPLAGSYAPGPRSARHTGPQARRDPLRDTGPQARRDPLRDTGPQARRDPLRDTGPQSRRDPLRDSGQWARPDTGPLPIQDTGPLAPRDTRPRPEQPRRSTAANPARDRDLAMLTGLASTPPPIPGALDDDPLTSPSFSLKADTAADSRSYGNSRKHAKHSAQGARGNGAAHANGNGNGTGSYPAADYAGAGYAYQAAPPAAPAEQWHSAPPAPAKGRHTAGYGNPYQHAGPSASRGGYDADPLGGYSPSAYEGPRYGEPVSPAYQALPDPGMAAPPGPVPHANGHARHSYPGQAAYPDGNSAGGYTNGYDAGYGGDPYAGGGYGPYPSRG